MFDLPTLLKRLRELPFPETEYWAVAGAAMVLHGFRPQTRDIDLGCSTLLADQLEGQGCAVSRCADGTRRIAYAQDVELFERWLEGSVGRAQGVPVVSVEGLVQMKRKLGRDKDLADVALIEAARGRPGKGASPMREITYVPQPTPYQCGQACVAMLAGVTAGEVAAVMGNDKGTGKKDIARALAHYGVPQAQTMTKADHATPLPEVCILKVLLPGYGHWVLYAHGVYYDPEFGVSRALYPKARVQSYLEIDPEESRI